MRATLIASLFLTACAVPTDPGVDEPDGYDPDPVPTETTQLAVCAAGDGVLEAGWSVDNGHGAVSALTMSASGSAALAGADGTIKLWDISSGELDWSSDRVSDPAAVYGSEMPTDGPLNALSFDDTGTYIAGGDDAGMVAQFTAETGLAHAAWEVGTEPVTAVAQGFEGQQLASATTAFGGELRTWYQASGPEGDVHQTDLWFVNALRFDGEEFAVAGDVYGEPAVELRSSSFPTVVQGLAVASGMTGTANDVANLGEGRFLLGGAGFLVVLDVYADQNERPVVSAEMSGSIVAVAALDADHFAAATEDGQVLVGTLSDLAVQATLDSQPMTTLKAVPGGWQLAASGDDGVLRLIGCNG
jgi:hypothetical protein